jgi:hypothetical protein
MDCPCNATELCMFIGCVSYYHDMWPSCAHILKPLTDQSGLKKKAPINSLTAKSVPAGTKLVLFGRYVLNIYVGIVQYFLRKTKTWRAKIYLPTQRTNWGTSYDIN